MMDKQVQNFKLMQLMSMGIIFLILISCTASLQSSASNYVDPSAISSIEQVYKTQILILGTPHLATLGEKFNSQSTGPLLDKLQAFSPDIIAVESLSPYSILSMRAQGDVYKDVLDQFAEPMLQFAIEVQSSLGLSYDEAVAKIDERLNSPAAETLDHRELTALFIASYDMPSAGLHWLQVDEQNRKPDEIISSEIVQYLSERLTSSNEIWSLAVPLALRLGHNRLASIDDHLDKDDLLKIAGPLSQELQAHPLYAEVAESAIFAEGQAVLDSAIKTGNYLSVYRFHNDPATQSKDIQAQWDFFLRTKLESGLDRTRLALWDVRNFNIASHIRRVSAHKPGGKILVIIGASHKPFLEAALSHVMDVEIVDVLEILSD